MNSENKKEFKVNEYLTLKLEGGRTFIYVKGKLFRQCIRLVIHIPVGEVEQYDQIDSIDEAFELYRRLDEKQFYSEDNKLVITPEEEFWGHCSNIQAWVEHDYDIRLLHSNLAFPLLKALAKEGLDRARMRFKFEIMKRFEIGSPFDLLGLIQRGYIFYLGTETIRQKIAVLKENKTIYKHILVRLISELESHLKKRNRQEQLEKLRKENGLNGICIECGGHLILIRERAEIVCSECGLVLNEKLVTEHGMSEAFYDYFSTVML